MFYKESNHRLDWGCENIVLLQHTEEDISGGDSSSKRQAREDVRAKPRKKKSREAPVESSVEENKKSQTRGLDRRSVSPGGRPLKDKPAKTRRVQRGETEGSIQISCEYPLPEKPPPPPPLAPYPGPKQSLRPVRQHRFEGYSKLTLETV